MPPRRGYGGGGNPLAGVPLHSTPACNYGTPSGFPLACNYGTPSGFPLACNYGTPSGFLGVCYILITLPAAFPR